jgi:uncharacterized membrane protein YoaK (UPF0700 family)
MQEHRVLVSLAVLTVVSGVGDAISYLGLGHVFVANMTGNVVFVGFAAAGAGQLSVSASLIALGSFLLGSLAGGRLGRAGTSPARRLRSAVVLQVVPLSAATVIAIAAGHTGADARRLLIVALALAMGLQNASVRALGVPDMTTTVLTLTLTGLAADSSVAGGSNPRWVRRLSSVCLMLAGAVIGAVLLLRVGMPVALGVMLALAATAGARCRTRRR